MKRIGVIIGGGVLALALLWLAGGHHEPLQEMRRTHALAHTEPLENAPPLVVFSTIALGGFNGFIADLLWVRAAQLQMDGQFVELVQLADWITSLQPRFAQGWVYHAWNLAYNVSVMFEQGEDRWRWVRHGVELLRDRALRYNPRDPTLYRELSWLFQHKIGSNSDQAHLYYKLQWALEMETLFTGRAPDYTTLAQTPATRAELMDRRGMTALLTTLQQAGFDPFSYQWPAPERMPEFLELLHDSAAGHTLLNHLRLRIMIDRYGLHPDRMQTLEGEVGPLDWRLPQAHAIYWAAQGRPYATDFDALALDRAIFQNLADAFRQGRLDHRPADGIFMLSPNPDIWPFVRVAFEEAMQAHEPDLIRSAYLNFLNHALSVLYTYNRQADVRDIFATLQEQYPEETAGRTLDEYALAQFVDRLDELGDWEIVAFIEGAFYQHFFWSALGDAERAAGYDRLARQTWQAYMEPRQADAAWRERTGLPPLADIRQAARAQAAAAIQDQE
jgi:hypothetical protein